MQHYLDIKQFALFYNLQIENPMIFHLFLSVYRGVCLHIIPKLIFSKPWYLFHLHTLPKIHLFEYSPIHLSYPTKIYSKNSQSYLKLVR